MLIDFEYNGKKLSDFGMSIVSFNGINDDLDVGNNVENSEVKVPNSYEYLPIGLRYDNALEVNFQIANLSCDKRDSVEYLTDEIINSIMRWLNRKSFYKFKPIYDDEQYNDVFFKGKFNLKLLKVGGKPIGFDLTFNANAPFGFREIDDINFSFSGLTQSEIDSYTSLLNNLIEEKQSCEEELELIREKRENGTDTAEDNERYSALGLRLININEDIARYQELIDSSGSLIINDISDEIGHQYADAIIECKESGELEITNTLDNNNTVVIRNCVDGEIITLHGKEKIISSSVNHPNISNDFNYNFIRICNTYDDTENEFSSSLKCNITIQYEPIRKVGIIV